MKTTHMVTDRVTHENKKYNLKEMVQIPPYPEDKLVEALEVISESEYVQAHIYKSAWEWDGLLTFFEYIIKDIEAEEKCEKYEPGWLEKKGYTDGQ